jgi:hypothetical protein
MATSSPQTQPPSKPLFEIPPPPPDFAIVENRGHLFFPRRRSKEQVSLLHILAGYLPFLHS